MTVDAAEAWIARTGKVAAALADAAPAWAADVGGDVPHSGRVVGRHGNSAAVDRCGGGNNEIRCHRFWRRPQPAGRGIKPS